MLEYFIDEGSNSLTKFWGFISIIYYCKILSNEDIKKKIESMLKILREKNKKDNVYWSCIIWLINKKKLDS